MMAGNQVRAKSRRITWPTILKWAGTRRGWLDGLTGAPWPREYDGWEERRQLNYEMGRQLAAWSAATQKTAGPSALPVSSVWPVASSVSPRMALIAEMFWSAPDGWNGRPIGGPC